MNWLLQFSQLCTVLGVIVKISFTSRANINAGVSAVNISFYLV